MPTLLKEIIGIAASGIVLISMLAKTRSYKGNMFMRSVNTVGCFAFILYGVFLPSPTTILMNSVICIVNIVYMIKDYRNEHKKKNILVVK